MVCSPFKVIADPENLLSGAAWPTEISCRVLQVGGGWRLPVRGEEEVHLFLGVVGEPRIAMLAEIAHSDAVLAGR